MPVLVLECCYAVPVEKLKGKILLEAQLLHTKNALSGGRFRRRARTPPPPYRFDGKAMHMTLPGHSRFGVHAREAENTGCASRPLVEAALFAKTRRPIRGCVCASTAGAPSRERPPARPLAPLVCREELGFF